MLSSCAFISCASNKKTSIYNIEKLKIYSIDSTADFYVFGVQNNLKKQIIIAEKNKIKLCKPFKKYIISDSIKEETRIKSGSKYVMIGFNEFTINKIKIKEKGELTKVINNCNSFSN